MEKESMSNEFSEAWDARNETISDDIAEHGSVFIFSIYHVFVCHSGGDFIIFVLFISHVTLGSLYVLSYLFALFFLSRTNCYFFFLSQRL